MLNFFETSTRNINRVDATVLMGTITTLAAAVCIAGLIPAHRAASVDPSQTLRSE